MPDFLDQIFFNKWLEFRHQGSYFLLSIFKTVSDMKLLVFWSSNGFFMIGQNSQNCVILIVSISLFILNENSSHSLHHMESKIFPAIGCLFYAILQNKLALKKMMACVSEDANFSPRLPKLPKMPKMPRVLKIPRMPKMPRVSSVTRASSLPLLPKFSGLSRRPRLPRMPSSPGLPRLPRSPIFARFPRLPQSS